MAYTAQKVTFPFGEALSAASALWSLAATINDDVEPARQQAAHTAEQQFAGNYANQFHQRMQTSASNARTTAYDLQQAAIDIANAWADAQHQQQLYLYYAMVQHKKDSKSFLQQASDWITGDDTNYGQPPARPETPSAPSFAASHVPQADVPGEVPPPIG
ncbi:MAG: hypothetical protein J2P57_04955 [Acidimicrobiaceae bacterium]|nr:hypothetical protein [Acidimicrobiaceae bacterium]